MVHKKKSGDDEDELNPDAVDAMVDGVADDEESEWEDSAGDTDEDEDF
jgi:hypothetical protein